MGSHRSRATKIGTSKRTSRDARSRRRSEPDPLAARVGARIRELRRELAFTFDAFVGETELGRGYVSELERGLVVPTIGTLARIARALDVTLADLVVEDTDRERLFVELRSARPALIRELRDRAKVGKPSGRV